MDVEPKIGGWKTPKMDGENFMENSFKMDDLGGTIIFWKHPHLLALFFSNWMCPQRMLKQLSFGPPKSKEKSRISCILHKIMASSIIKIKAIHLNIQSMC